MNRIAKGETVGIVPRLPLLDIDSSLLWFVVATCRSADVARYFIRRLCDHSSDIAGNASVFDCDVFLAQNPGSPLVLERDTNGQHGVVIALLEISKRGYSRRVIVYVSLNDQLS